MYNARNAVHFLHWLDWMTVPVSLGLGIYWMSWWWIGFGIMAIPLAWWNPGKRLHEHLLRKITRQTRPGPQVGNIISSDTPIPTKPPQSPLPDYSETISRPTLPYGF